MMPTICVLSADESGQIDGTVQKLLIDYLPVVSKSEADVAIVFISYLHVFKFSEQLLHINKPIVLVDFTEYGWDFGDKNNQWGTGAHRDCGHLNTPEYALFDAWVQDRPPVLTFQRELQQRDRSPIRLPVEWPCDVPAVPLQTKEEFDARPMEVLFVWGLSNPSRPRLHGDIFRNSHDCGINVLSDWRDDGHFEKRNWAALYSPHWRRTHINEVHRWNQRAKISVSLPGAGAKCFRHTMESPVGSIMALPFDTLAWSFEWLHLVNCIRLVPGHEFTSLESVTHCGDLWDIYRWGQATVDRWRPARYVSEYIMPAIASIL